MSPSSENNSAYDELFVVRSQVHHKNFYLKQNMLEE